MIPAPSSNASSMAGRRCLAESESSSPRAWMSGKPRYRDSRISRRCEEAGKLRSGHMLCEGRLRAVEVHEDLKTAFVRQPHQLENMEDLQGGPHRCHSSSLLAGPTDQGENKTDSPALSI